MSNEEILTKAIEKAEKNGFELFKPEWILHSKSSHEERPMNLQERHPTSEMPFVALNTIIFSHDFLISFFGKEWKKHAKEMVVTKNPLDYLSRFC